MPSIIKTYAANGLQGFEIVCECDSNKSLPGLEIIGLADIAIKESKERIRASFRHVGLQIPNRKFIVNLAPSHVRKVGSSFDLPIAMSIISHIYKEASENTLATSALRFGELGLGGDIKRVNGLLPLVISAINNGYTHFFVPAENAYELSYLPGITYYPMEHLQQIVDRLIHGQAQPSEGATYTIENLITSSCNDLHDFKYIKGHTIAKRALMIAAAGFHNVMMIGAPGSGKTMLSKALQTILPPLKDDEIIETSQIYSLVGKLTKDQPLITTRPFRSIHHTATKVSIIGGGPQLRPGELSLAHRGILFADELPEFSTDTLDTLRQPLEDKIITISRAIGTVQYPCNIMFIAAMNPCKCGFYQDPDKQCTCSIHEVKRYQSKISGPILDRIDMILEIPRENIDTILGAQQQMNSTDMRTQVTHARHKQLQRFKGTNLGANAHMGAKDIDTYITLDEASNNLIKQAVKTLNLSPRIIHRILKLARTIADLDDSNDIQLHHITESLQYRSKSMFVE